MRVCRARVRFVESCVGWGGVGWGGPQVRTPMQWKAKEPNGGFSTSTKLYAPVVNDETFGYDIVNVDSQYAVRRRPPPPAPTRPHPPPSAPARAKPSHRLARDVRVVSQEWRWTGSR